jgi:hypothetical protein
VGIIGNVNLRLNLTRDLWLKWVDEDTKKEKEVKQEKTKDRDEFIKQLMVELEEKRKARYYSE